MGRTRIVRTPEEAAAIPPDRGVTVELSAEDPKKTEGAEVEKTEPVSEPEPQVTEPETEQEEVEEPESPLAKQLADLKAAEELAQRQLAESRAREEQAVRAAHEQTRELMRERAGRDQAEYDAVLNALGAAQSEVDRATSDWEVAMSAQDFRTASEAQRRLAIASNRVVGLEDSKVMLESRREEQRATPQQQYNADPIAAAIDSMNNLSAKQRDWLKGHRDAYTDPAKNAYLGAAHHDAIRAGHAQDSDGYFQLLEEKLGYRQARAEQRKSVPVSAPVSREAPTLSGAPASPSRITLTQAQREAARIAGIDEFTYAKNLLKLNARKKDGHYQEQTG